MVRSQEIFIFIMLYGNAWQFLRLGLKDTILKILRSVGQIMTTLFQKSQKYF